MASVEETKRELQELIKQADALIQKLSEVDSVTAVAQLARFDLVTLLLAIVSIVLVLGGLFAFGFVRGQASAIAKDTAEKVAEDRLTELLSQIDSKMNDLDDVGGRKKAPTARPSTASATKTAGENE